MKDKQKILVVGGGIVGAALAWSLARRGAAVTLLERERPAAGSTSRAFAWINVSHGQPEPYRQLRHLAVEEWRCIEPQLPGLSIDWCGALTWTAAPGDTERFVAEHAAAGYGVRLLAAEEIRRLEPGLAEPPPVAAHAAGEGALDPIAATEALLAAARRAGATILTDVAATALRLAGERVVGVDTDKGPLEADCVVLAAGVGSTALAAGAGIALPVEASPSILVSLGRQDRRLLNGIVCGPELEARQAGDGRLFAAEDPHPDRTPEAIAEGALAALRRIVRDSGSVRVERVQVGLRPMPADGLPILGFAPGRSGLYLAAMHAGITLGPVAARLAAGEILDGGEAPELSGCRIARFGS